MFFAKPYSHFGRNVKNVLCLSDGNGTRTHNHLVRMAQMVVGASPVAVTSTSDIAPVSNKKFLDIQGSTECGFTMKRVRDMIRIYKLY